MSKKIVVVGGVAGGASAAARARRIDESAEIVMFEKGPHVSFSNCCLPYHLSGVVEKSSSLVLMDPVRFKRQYNIEARVSCEVTEICRAQKTVKVTDHASGEQYEEHYDELVLSPGAAPIVPGGIEGIHAEHVFTVRNVVDISKIKSYLEQNSVQDVAVIGGGFIGLEVAENLRLAGRHVTVVEAAEQVMAPFDYDMAQILHKELMDNGVDLIVGDGLKQVSAEHIVLSSGKKVDAGAVILAIGVRPETGLAVDAGLEIGETGGIKVDHNFRTSDPSIYAVGDAIEVFNSLTRRSTRLALAGPAQRQARSAADAMYGRSHRGMGVIGCSCIQLFELSAASVGLSEKAAHAAGIPCGFAYVIPNDKVGLMPGNSPVHFKLVYECPTGRILGAQCISRGNVTKRADVVATMIAMGGCLEDLKELELCYAPAFGTARDVVNYAALVASNLLEGRFRQVPVTMVRELVERDACIIDVREENEFARGHLLNAVNIPLSQLRDRMEEIPRDVPVYLHCRSSQRSYNAVMALQGNGYDNVFNISGSYLGICLYEYYNDVVTGRDKIVTEYNFR